MRDAEFIILLLLLVLACFVTGVLIGYEIWGV
jgi:hypothetical protein